MSAYRFHLGAAPPLSDAEARAAFAAMLFDVAWARWRWWTAAREWN